MQPGYMPEPRMRKGVKLFIGLVFTLAALAAIAAIFGG